MSGRLGALSAAISAETSRRVTRAILIAAGAGLLADFALGASILPDGIAGNLLIAYGIFLATFGISLGLLLLQGFSGPFGDALAVAAWARLDAEERRKAAGAGRIPRSPAEARAWLASHEDRGRFQAPRLSVQIMAGELAAARETLATYPHATALERFEAVDDGWFLDFLDGEAPSLAPLEAASGELTEEGERSYAAVVIATLRAHLAVAEARDWIQPLAAERGRLGDRASGIVGARYVAASWTMVMAAASAMIGVAMLVGSATGIWSSG